MQIFEMININDVQNRNIQIFKNLNPTLTDATVFNNPLVWVFNNQIKALWMSIMNMDAKLTNVSEMENIYDIWVTEQWLKLNKRLALSNFTINGTNYSDLTNWTITNTTTRNDTNKVTSSGTNQRTDSIGYQGGDASNQISPYQTNTSNGTTRDTQDGVSNGTTTFTGQDLNSFFQLLINETSYSLMDLRNRLIRMFAIGVIS